MVDRVVAAPNSKQETWRFAPLHKLRNLFPEKLSLSVPQIDFSQETLWEKRTAGFSIEPVCDEDYYSVLGAKLTNILVEIDFSAAQLTTDELITSNLKIDGLNSQEHAAVFYKIHIPAGRQVALCMENNSQGNILENLAITIGDGATLDLYLIQNTALDTGLLSAQSFSLGKDACLNYFCVTWGGSFVRNLPVVSYTSTGGVANLYGLYFADENQYIENRISVKHTQANCKSNILYKGALQNNSEQFTSQNEAQTTWVGDVSILPAATGTDTYEINRNLLLTKGTKIESVPNLEIQTGEIINAGHASAIATFSEEQLFYLLSRGVSEDEAKKLLLQGFFKEIINKISVDSVIDKLTKEMELELSVDG